MSLGSSEKSISIFIAADRRMSGAPDQYSDRGPPARLGEIDLRASNKRRGTAVAGTAKERRVARSIPGWERLKPSIGESGKPGWRLLSHDGQAEQIAVYFKKDGPWKGSLAFCEWRLHDKRWCIYMRDVHDRLYGPAYHEHFEPALDAFNNDLAERGLPPIF
jgi:hypothetical protein